VNGAQTLTIRGANLTGTSAVAASPSTGITIGTPSVSPDGATVTVSVTLTTATPVGFVNITLSGSYGSTPTTSASSLQVVP
jgi:predicted secreted protein